MQIINKVISIILLSALGISTLYSQSDNNQSIDKKILVTGGVFNKKYIKYLATLTGKADPKICFIPTATGDKSDIIIRFYSYCEDLNVRPYILKTFIESTTSPKSFEEIIMDMDAIVVGGGNTLNMLAIWKAQGVDLALKKAYEKGTIMAGGSAGSLCWFTGGSTDSRPKELSVVECLGFLNYSYSPHYLNEITRRPLYQKLILSSKLKPGYACDDQAGLLFINGKVSKSVTLNKENKNYFVSIKDGKISEEIIPAEIID
jgi:dipeptidase E